MNTYTTDTEMALFWPAWNDSGYSSAEQTNALETSYGLVNSYIAGTVRIPHVSRWDLESETIESPSVLKLAQSQFAKFILMTNEYGQTEEQIAQFAATVEMLRMVEDGDLIIEGVSVGEAAIGWNLNTNSSTQGMIHIQSPAGYAETYPVVYVIEIDTGSDDKHPHNADNNSTDFATFKYKEYGASAWEEEGVNAENRWVNVGTHNLSILFQGIFDDGDAFEITGTPATAQTVSSPDRLYNKKLSYK